MKNLHYFSKSRLLFTLIALFMGISSSWAETLTENFNDVSVTDDTHLSNGWVVVGSGNYAKVSSSSTNYDFYLHSSLGRSESKALGSYGSCGSWIVIPVEIIGDLKFYYRRYRNNYNGNVYVRKATQNGNSYTIATTNLATISTSSNSWSSEYTVNVGTEATYVAFQTPYSLIDDVTYTEYIEEGCPKPKSLTATGITEESAVLGWTSDADSWGIRYKAEGDANWSTINSVTENPYTLTGLDAGTNYTFQIQAICSTESQSDWSTEGAFTTSLCAASAQKNITLTMWDTYGDGWNGAYLQIIDVATGTEVAKYTLTNDDGQAQVVKTVGLCPNRTYNINWITGSYNSECRFIVTDVDGNTLLNYSSTYPSSSTTFTTYQWLNGPKMVVSETALDFGTITAESSDADKTKTFTISNTGTATLEGITVSYLGDEVFSTSPAISAQSIEANGDAITVTVTMAATTTGNFSGNITVSATDQTNVIIPVTGIYAAAPATMAITLGEEAVGDAVAFGNVGKQAQKTFTITNDGNLKLNVSIASNNTTDFTVSPASLEVAGGSSETFTVTFLYDKNTLNAEKTATITVTPSNEGLTAKSFTVTGTRIEQWSEDFSGNALPEGWETTSTTYWTFADGVAKGSYPGSTAYYLITPSLIVDGTSASLSFDYAATGNYTSIIIQKSKDGGDWENCTTTPTIGSLNTGNSGTATITGLESGNYKFRFKADSYNLDNFEGFKRNLNDPKLGIYTDAGCTVATTTSVTKDFDFVTTEQTVNYYIKNDGTGTMTLSKGDVPAGFTATLDKTSVASGEHATLTITMPAENKGYHSGYLVITATDLGTFTVALSGVMVDENKLNLDFATDNIPSTWTANSWTKNNDGYMEVGYTASTIQTSTLNAAVNEQLVVVAKQSYTSSSYTFGVKYREVGTETWNDLIAAANIGTSWVTLAATIETAGAYELQFTGNYTQIKRIYGLTEPNEPVMVVYDGESVAGDAYDFGNVPDDDDAVWTLTVKNEGKSVLTGLAAELTGTNAAHYSYEITGATGTNSDEIQPNATATITVKQLKDYLGDHEATLTISATGLDSKVITLSGTTRDHTKLFVDFDNPNSIPEGWKAGTSWSVYTYGTDRYAQQTNYNTASALVTTPLIVAANETLKFQAARYYSSSACELKVRYTTDGGVSWSDYVDYSSQIASSSFVNLELTGVPEGTAVVEFYGRYVKLDNISGFAPTTAPMLALTEGNDAVASGDTKAFGNLTADGVATYTLTNNGNANMVSNVYAIGYAEVEISGEGEGVTLEKVNNSETYNKVTLEPGKSATLTLTVKYEAPFTEKNGEMVIETEGWVGDMTVNYTSNSIDPTAVYIDFADGKKPDGFYSNGWTYTSGYAANSNTTAAEFITSKLTVAGEDDIITFDARAAWDGYGEELIVEYSTAANNRAAWTEVKILSESDLTSTFQTFQIKGLDAGDYYLRFSGKRVYVDNIMGWHYAQPAAEHDLYVTSVYPEESILVPGTEITVTADVTSLIADEEGVYTKLYCRNADTSTSEVLVTSTTTEDISKDGTKTFTMTATLPNTEAHYRFSVGAFLSDGTEIMISKRSNLYNLQHTRTMEITEYTRTDGDGALDANANNQISASFSVKVKNTGTAAAFPIVKIKVGDVVVGEATPDLILIPGNESAIDVNLNNISAFEGGELNFVAEAYWNATDAEPKAVSDPIVITVNAVAPKFALYTYPGDTPVNDGDDVDFGLIKQMTAHNYVIKNEGNKDMEFVGITCPDGFSATSILDEGKKIVAANGGYLAFDVYMDYNVGRKNGQLVITYKVDESTNKTFTLILSGRSVSADTWTEPFDDTYTAIPDNWTNNGWQVASGSSDYPGAAYSYNETATLMTPRLAAAEGEVLTFDVASNSYGFTYAYSTDGGATWSDEINVAAGTTGEQSFTAPAEGNYYLRFTGRYGYLRNFVGFKLSSLGDLTLLDTEDFGDNIELGRYETVTVSRTFNKGWGTVVLPFDVDAATVQAKFGEGTKLYTLSDFNATTGDIQFSPVYNGKIAAGTPYLINIPEAIDNGITFENVTVVADVNDKVLDNGAEFHGNYDAGMSMVDLFGITPEGKIAKGVGSSTMKAYRAYMVLPGNVDPNNARLVIFDETTGISRVLNDVELENTNIYNLNGQRVNKSAKGILLINGKKVMIK